MAMASSLVKKPHAVFIPLPLQSHIKCMLNLAKFYQHKGFYITFINTHYNHKRILNSRGPNALDGSPDFQFKSIPDGLPVSDDFDVQQDVAALCDSIKNNNCLAPFIALLKELNGNENTSKVSVIVADGLMSFTIRASQQLGIPLYFFFTVAACGLMTVFQFRACRDKRISLPEGENYDLSTDRMYDFLIEAVERAHEANGVILHTFDALERDILDYISLFLPKLYTIGPLQLLLNDVKEAPLKSVGCNLWKEDEDYLRWLDTKEQSSVVYISFGSSTTLTNKQLVEFGMGLANSKCSFLWVIRHDLVVGERTILPQEFMVAVKERGMVLSWCSQEEVLNHPSVGGFLTHCGWGSMIESLSAGKAMLCWPFFGDQVSNCRSACEEWGVGMEIDNNVKRDEVEKLVKELMDGENGKKIKKKAMEWKIIARNATSSSNGSSYLNLDKLVHMKF